MAKTTQQRVSTRASTSRSAATNGAPKLSLISQGALGLEPAGRSADGSVREVHWVSKGVQFVVEVSSRGTFDLSQASLAVSLVYDREDPAFAGSRLAAAAPSKGAQIPVESILEEPVQMAVTPSTRDSVILTTRIHALSSRHPVQTFRMVIEARAKNGEVIASLLTHPIRVVSKPRCVLPHLRAAAPLTTGPKRKFTRKRSTPVYAESSDDFEPSESSEGDTFIKEEALSDGPMISKKKRRLEDIKAGEPTEPNGLRSRLDALLAEQERQRAQLEFLLARTSAASDSCDMRLADLLECFAAVPRHVREAVVAKTVHQLERKDDASFLSLCDFAGAAQQHGLTLYSSYEQNFLTDFDFDSILNDFATADSSTASSSATEFAPPVADQDLGSLLDGVEDIFRYDNGSSPFHSEIGELPSSPEHVPGSEAPSPDKDLLWAPSELPVGQNSPDYLSGLNVPLKPESHSNSLHLV